jgi:ATP-dependent DNA helicase PIF1
MESLNEKQKQCAHTALKGKNMFISGAAGVGKSFLLRVLVKLLNEKYIKKGKAAVAVTALTGIAAITIEGTTLHSFAGMGHDLSKTVSWVARNRWRQTKVLIIDEVSMMTDEFLEKIFEFIKLYKVQIICFGDFYQLNPINGKSCFMSPIWEILGLKDNTYELTDIIRQKDKQFIQALNAIRIGEITDEITDFLYTMDIDNVKDIPRCATKLYAINRGVDEENYKRLNKLPTKLITLYAHDTITKGKKKFPTTHAPREIPFILQMIEKEAPTAIDIKVGAEVMLTRNRPDCALVNGSRGKVKKYDEPTKIPTVEFDNGITVPIIPIEYEIKIKGYKITRMQCPLRLAYALTVHRAQGLTLNNVLATTHSSFANGQLYTSLSRCTTPQGLIINNVESLIHRNKISLEAKEYYRTCGKK